MEWNKSLERDPIISIVCNKIKILNLWAKYRVFNTWYQNK